MIKMYFSFLLEHKSKKKKKSRRKDIEREMGQKVYPRQEIEGRQRHILDQRKEKKKKRKRCIYFEYTHRKEKKLCGWIDRDQSIQDMWVNNTGHSTYNKTSVTG